MVRLSLVLMVLTMMTGGGCDDPQRMTRLEKENADLKAQLSSEKNVTRNYDLEARCSKDARVWFGQNYSRDKDTTLLDFSNHYHVPSNQCYIFVEYHWRQGAGDSWMNSIALWNVYENNRVGSYIEKTTPPRSNRLIQTRSLRVKCLTPSAPPSINSTDSFNLI
jgi:hypothetical protein